MKAWFLSQSNIDTVITGLNILADNQTNAYIAKLNGEPAKFQDFMNELSGIESLIRHFDNNRPKLTTL